MVSITYKEQNWTSRDLALLAEWLIKKKEYGYALLCLLGASLGLKIGELLKLTWKDILDPYDDCEEFFFWKNPLIIDKPISYFIQRKVSTIYQMISELVKEVERNDFIFMNLRTKKVLSTATLNRELRKFQNEFNDYVESQTGIKLNLVELKSNAFEIAWGIDLVEKYGNNKKAFIAVSKRLGHRQLKDTVRLLDREIVENIIEWIDMLNLSISEEEQMEKAFENKENLKKYISTSGYIKPSFEFFSESELDDEFKDSLDD
jgi:integrase